MPDVLVNYRTADARFGAAATYELLSVRFGKERLFLDNQSIPPGRSYVAEVLRALESIRVLLVLIGPAWLAGDPDAPGRLLLERDDDWVRREIRRAIERDVHIVPVLLDGSVMPNPAVLPADIRPLVVRQAVEIRHHHLGEDVNRLADHLTTLVPDLVTLRPPVGEPSVAMIIRYLRAFLSAGHGVPELPWEAADEHDAEVLHLPHADPFVA